MILDMADWPDQARRQESAEIPQSGVGNAGNRRIHDNFAAVATKHHIGKLPEPVLAFRHGAHERHVGIQRQKSLRRIGHGSRHRLTTQRLPRFVALPAPADRAGEVARQVCHEMTLVELGKDHIVVKQDMEQFRSSLGRLAEDSVQQS